MKQGQVSRVDLFNSLIKKNDRSTRLIAKQLALKLIPKKDPENEIITHVSITPTSHTTVPETNDSPLKKSPTAQLKARYWQVLKQKDRQLEKSKKKAPLAVKQAQWRNRPKELPAFPALSSLADLRSRIFPLLDCSAQAKQHIDIDEIINKISRAEFITQLPKKQKKHTPQAIQIIDDRQVHLTPYWLDHAWITKHIDDSFASYQINRAVIQNGESHAQSLDDNLVLSDYQIAPENSPILILSDLGRLSPDASHQFDQFNAKQIHYWQQLEQLSQTNPVIVISPCHPKDYPQKLRKTLNIIAWERQPIRLYCADLSEQLSEEKIQHWLSQLLRLASPCVRIESQLLRCLRLGLEAKIPAAIESLFWQHACVKAPHIIAATLDTEMRKQYRNEFFDESVEHQAIALRTLRQWRANLPQEIWVEELLTIEPMIEWDKVFEDEERQLFQQDIEDACGFLQQMLDEKNLYGKKKAAYQAWISRLEKRISNKAVQHGKSQQTLQRLFAQLEPSASITKSGHAIDPTLLPASSTTTVKAMLSQHGRYLGLSNYDPVMQSSRHKNSSIIAPIEYSRMQMNGVSTQGDNGVFYFPSEELASDVLLIKETEKIQIKEKLVIKTDRTEISLQAIERPEWASEIGRDAHGLYADLEIAKQESRTLKQRFRWIPAGEFMMGSPGNEKERFEDEDYHQVILNQGFWLADTTVTQAVWQAVTGENPSEFEGDMHPVDRVSWDDANDFINILTKNLSEKLGGLQLTLPTEAEWEYACRAGTTTPFSFGENITPDQVNYDGGFPYADGEKGKYRKKTVKVKSLPINPWGLYEMHGNLWEWCVDAWQKQLGSKVVVDPCYKGEKGAHRVVRGGSWNDRGRDVRSAYRIHYSSDMRYNDIGFRLSLGQVS